MCASVRGRECVHAFVLPPQTRHRVKRPRKVCSSEQSSWEGEHREWLGPDWRWPIQSPHYPAHHNGTSYSVLISEFALFEEGGKGKGVSFGRW